MLHRFQTENKQHGTYLSEDPGPHAVFLFLGAKGWEGVGYPGCDCRRRRVPKISKINKKILVFDGVGHGF